MMRRTKLRHILLSAAAILLSAGWSLAAEPAADANYNPLTVDAKFTPKTLDLTITDKARNREIPITVYLPDSNAPAPIVLFSHGLGGSRNNNPYLGKHWAARGYVAVFMQHAGSDQAVWKDKPAAERMTSLKAAASASSFMLRVKDVPAVLNQFEQWNKTEGNALAGRMDANHIGMSGHSFGAVTTQAVSGQHFLGKAMFSDPRIKAAIAFSPSVPKRASAKAAFGGVSIPWLLMTGTKDASPIEKMDPAARQEVFPALPPGSKYELVLDGAEHSAFGDRALPGEGGKRNPNHHRAILALSTAFWDAYLRNDKAAKAWLDGDGPRSVLEKADTWQKK